MIPESHGCTPLGRTASDLLIALEGSSVTVWTTCPALVQVTVAPFGIVRSAGRNWLASFISTANDWPPELPLAAAPPPQALFSNSVMDSATSPTNCNRPTYRRGG